MTETSKSSFLRPGKLILFVLAGLLVYLVALVFLVPAGWVWQQLAGQIRLPPQFSVQAVTGSVWDGAAGIRLQGRPLKIDWDLGWPSLTEMSLPVDLTVETSASELSGALRVGWPFKASLDARGKIHVPEFEDLIRQSGGAMLEGDVVIDRLQLSWAEQQLTEARGTGQWPGGTVTWPVGDSRQSAQFPAMSADLRQSNDGVSLSIAQSGQGEPAAEADILRNGMLEVRVYKRLVDLAGQPWSGAAAPGDVVFRVQQPLLPGVRF